MDISELRRKAESGSVVSQAVLGICHLYGREVKVDYTEALRLLSAAADKGSSRAIVNLARMYSEGPGSPEGSLQGNRSLRDGSEGGGSRAA